MLIGLHGKLGAGKDEAFKLLCEHPDTGLVIRKAFADPLKLSAARALGCDGNFKECLEYCNAIKNDASITVSVRTKGSVSSHKVITGREFLQWYGDEAHREVFDEDFWVNESLPKGTDIPSTTLVVFTDVRFVNEAQRIKDCGGEVWEIVRPPLSAHDPHRSENRLPARYIDRAIFNSGTKEELQEKLIGCLLGPPHMRTLVTA